MRIPLRRSPSPAATPPSEPLRDLVALYRAMLRARAFELLLLSLWEEGRISGELHLGTGEEAVAAGLAARLRKADALALDHRATPLLLLRGVDPVAMVREALGRTDGLCRGAGGHMHLFSRGHLAATSGIVGASGPAAAGFALAASRLRPGTVAVATFGEGAMNQGMLLEAMNLAAAWRLPVLFVCKDNGRAITTRSDRVTAGDPAERATAMRIPVLRVDGTDPVAVRDGADPLLERAREGGGPGFLLARCPRLDGHMAEFIVDRIAARPIREGGGVLRKVAAAAVRGDGAGWADRMGTLGVIGEGLLHARRERRDAASDPVRQVREALAGVPDERSRVEAGVAAEMARVRQQALAEGGEP
jgi:hypothetical protein